MSSHAIIVLGIARSGTSALSGTLAHMGVPFGDKLKPADWQNPKGNYEHKALSQANQRILAAVDSNWSDLRPLPEYWLEKSSVKAEKSTISQIIESEFKTLPIFGIKDLRLVTLLPLYLDIFDKLDITNSILSTVRNKNEVLESIEKSTYFHGEYSAEKAEQLYDHYMTSIENIHSLHGGLSIPFEALLYQTDDTIDKIKQHLPKLAITFLAEQKQQPAFIDPKLHRCKLP